MRFTGVLALLVLTGNGLAGAAQIDLDTGSLANWSAISLPLTARSSIYTATTVDGRRAISVASNNGASGLVYDRVFKTYETPVLHWSWKAMNVLPNGNAETRQGDDYAIRIYVMFPYDVSRLSFLQRIRYAAAKQILGYYPPSEVLNYVWANRPHARDPLQSAFSDRGMMFFPDVGAPHLGEWRSHTVNLIDDIRRSFGIEPQETFRVAIMGDSDNTHGHTRAYISDIWVSSD